jgi:malonyl-CoA/methylmalonyl-CoA synthetase
VAALSNLYSALIGDKTTSNRVAISMRDGQSFTFADLDRDSARMANRLVARGVKPGDRVAVHTEKSVAALLTYLAVIRAGAVFLPLNTAYTPAELDYFLGDAEPRVLICDPSEVDVLRPIAKAKGVAAVETLGPAGEGTWTADLARESDKFALVRLTENDTAVILYTSGTTGRSKGAMLTIRNLASNAATLIDYWRITKEDRLLHALPIYHAHGLFVGANTSLMVGAEMLYHAKFDAADILADLPNATTMMGIPTFYTRLLAQKAFTKELVAHMRLFVSGSAPLSAETHREFSARTGHNILERYGMSETGMNTSNPYDGDRVPGSVGFPLPGITIRVTDPTTRADLPDGAVGMVEVKGPNVFKGYWRNSEKTRADLHEDGFFTTGDLGFRDARGYIFLVGRDKDLIITGGLNVYPAEIEAAIDEMPEVAESAVISCPHADFGEAVTAVISLRDGASLDEATVIRRLADKLAKFKQPKRVLFTKALPRNTMGKVQKNVLREENKALYASIKA